MTTIVVIMVVEVVMALTVACDLVRWARSLPPPDRPGEPSRPGWAPRR